MVETPALRRPPLIDEFVRKLPEENTREGFFEHDEVMRVIAHLPAYLQEVERFAYLTGWRAGELRQITWHQVDRKAATIHLSGRQTKNGRPRKLAMEGELRAIIERRWSARTYKRAGATHVSRYVFHRDGQPIGDYRKAWKSACSDADVPEKLFHDLRRTAVRNMVRAGVPETVAMAISGHRTRAVFDRYNITSEDDLRDAMTKTQAYLAEHA